MGVTGKPVSLKISCNYGINFSCHFHHQVYNELTIACYSVGLISALNKALHPVINRVLFPVKPEFFQVLFSAGWIVHSTAKITFNFIITTLLIFFPLVMLVK